MADAFITINYVAGTTAKVATHSMSHNKCFDDLVNGFWNIYNAGGAFYNFSVSAPGVPKRFISVAKSCIVDVIIQED